MRQFWVRFLHGVNVAPGELSAASVAQNTNRANNMTDGIAIKMLQVVEVLDCKPCNLLSSAPPYALAFLEREIVYILRCYYKLLERNLTQCVMACCVRHFTIVKYLSQHVVHRIREFSTL